MKKLIFTFFAIIMAVSMMAQTTVTFSVNMEYVFGFDAAVDEVFISGTPFEWAEPGTNMDAKMTDDDGDYIYTLVVELAEAGEIQYKYFLNAGWDGGEWGGDPNRAATVDGEVTLDDIFGFYVPVTFNVDMSLLDGFDATVDSVFVTGSIFGWNEPGTNPNCKMIDEDGDLIYTLTAYTPAAGQIDYKYFLNAGWAGGEWEGDPNRAIEVTIADTLIVENAVFGVLNGIENNLVENISVYPNPFQNELTIENMENIQSLKVYNMTGQIVKEVSTPGNNITIKTDDFNSGVYFVVFTNNQNKQGTIKLVRE